MGFKTSNRKCIPPGWNLNDLFYEYMKLTTIVGKMNINESSCYGGSLTTNGSELDILFSGFSRIGDYVLAATFAGIGKMDINESSCYGGSLTTNGSEWNILLSGFSRIGDYVLGATFAGIAVLSLGLNLMVILTISLSKVSSQPVELFILNMAVCDLLQSVICLPAISVSAVSHGWTMGMKACIAEAVFIFFFGCASIWNLAAMSFVRYIKVCWRNKEVKVTKHIVCGSIGLCYLHSGFWCSMPLLGWGEYGPEPYGITCSIAWTCASMSYIVSLLLACYVIPVTVMIFSYAKMAQAIRAVMKQSSLSSTSRHDNHVTKMAFAMCLCFLIAWTPYAITSLIYMSGQKVVHHSLTVASPLFAKTSVLLNPLVYFIAIKRFRQDAMRILCRQKLRESDKDNTLLATMIQTPIPMEDVEENKQRTPKNLAQYKQKPSETELLSF